MTAEIIIFIAVIIGVIGGLFLEKMRVRIDGPPVGDVINVPALGSRWNNTALPRRGASPSLLARVDRSEQLRLVSYAKFSGRRLMTVDEERVFNTLGSIIAGMGLDWRVMAQINLGEIIDTDDAAALAAVRDQHIDMLIVSADQLPIAAIEYAGNTVAAADVAVQDAIKREALRRAGIAYLEIVAEDSDADLQEQMRRLLARQKQLPGAVEA